MKLSHFDHYVLISDQIDEMMTFYTEKLGMEPLVFKDVHHAVRFGNSKISFHPSDGSVTPASRVQTPGSADFCIIADMGIGEVMEELKNRNVELVDGPVERRGAHGMLLSVYVRDPDGNLIEISEYL